MTSEELKSLSINTLAGASALEAADIARHAMTGKGQSWLPNSAYKNVTGTPGNFKTWLTSGPTLAGKAGLAGAVGYGSYKLTDWAIDQPWADKVGLGRNDFKEYGRDTYNFLSSLKKPK
jgi:hypothetical protein